MIVPEIVQSYFVELFIHGLPLVAALGIWFAAKKRRGHLRELLVEFLVLLLVPPLGLLTIQLLGEASDPASLWSRSKTLANLNTDPFALGCGNAVVFWIMHSDRFMKRSNLKLRLSLAVALSLVFSAIVHLIIPGFPE
jgi:hypothetical protein